MVDHNEAHPPHLGELEQAIMDIVWARQQATVREVANELPRTPALAYTTVATVMSRLMEKGLLVRSRSSKADIYRPAFDSAEFNHRVTHAAVQQLVREFGDVALAQFAEALARADPERVERLRARFQPQQPAEAQRPDKGANSDADA